MSGILVVCTGNICRSPMAEGFLQAALTDRLGASAPLVASAGTAGWDGSGATNESIRAARELGIDIGGHRARALTAQMLDEADLIVCMASDHRAWVLGMRPDTGGRTFTIQELVRLLEGAPATGPLAARVAAATAARNGATAAAEDIRDPLGDSIDGYREVAGELHDLSERLATALVGDPT